MNNIYKVMLCSIFTGLLSACGGGGGGGGSSSAASPSPSGTPSAPAVVTLAAVTGQGSAKNLVQNLAVGDLNGAGMRMPQQQSFPF